MEEIFVASQYLRREIYVFINKLSYNNLELVRPNEIIGDPICLFFKGRNRLRGHFQALVPINSTKQN